jgi:Flp pilus assembly protein TadD
MVPEQSAIDTTALLQRALDARSQGFTARACEITRAALATDPSRADAWTLLGLLEQGAGRHAAAEAAYRTAIDAHSGYADAWTNLGNLLRDRGDRRGALVAFATAMRLSPGDPEPIYNLGVALEHFGDWAGSLAAFEAVLECAPDHLDGHWNLALALLRQGDLERGFRHYEWRWRRGQPGPRQCAQPVWNGEPLEGLRVLVWAEQGFGDTLQFLRFVPELARRGARIVLEVPDTLHGLASRLPGVERACVRGDVLPPVDVHLALMSLPFALGTRALAPVPSYLQPDPGLTATWQARLRRIGGRRDEVLAAGLVWATNPVLRNARERSPGLAALQALLQAPGVRWFSLQKGAAEAELAAIQPPGAITDLAGDIDDFDDTAAIVANLDVVVTCDTAVAHLAGALGKPTFVLLPSTPDWRYGLAPDTTPWYPSMRLFRQSRRGCWDDVCTRVADALARAEFPYACPREDVADAGACAAPVAPACAR